MNPAEDEATAALLGTPLGSLSASGPAVSSSSSSSSSTASSSSQAVSGRDKIPGPWIIDEDMELIMRRRAITRGRLQAYLDQMHAKMHQLAETAQMMGNAGQAWFNEQMRELEPQVDLQAQIILFGMTEPNARRNFLVQYGCTRWTDEALDVIKKYGPILEIGAGHGQWQKALTDRGADVLAFDDQSALPMEGMPLAGVVSVGNEKEITKHRTRTLLLVYPGPVDMAEKCLKEYSGNTLLYVGEARGGVNGTNEFFDHLEKGWEVVQVVPVEPFPEGYESLWVLQRRKGAGRGWWGGVFGRK